MPEVTDLYCDGGLASNNPSAIGGTWAWVAVGDGVLLATASGYVTPEDMGTTNVTNNQTEALAAVRALESVPRGWGGILHTDSLVTLRRVNGGGSRKGVPKWLWRRLLRVRQGRGCFVRLVGGHPTRGELDAGRLRKNGLPVSRWNVLADQLCGRKARELLRSLTNV